MPPDRTAADGASTAFTAFEPRPTRLASSSRRRDRLALAASAGLHLLLITTMLGVAHVQPTVQPGAERSVTMVFELAPTPAMTDVPAPSRTPSACPAATGSIAGSRTGSARSD